jgi:hypothetical protein
MTKFYPTRNDLNKPDKVERVFRDLYDRVYKNVPVQTTKKDTKRININTGEVTGGK